MNKKSALYEQEKQKEKLMACKETKSPVSRKREYTTRKSRNENTILQQDKRAKVDEVRKKDILVQNKKQHQQRRNNFDEATKKSIQNKDTKQHEERKKNLDETSEKNTQAGNTKQHQQSRKNLD